MVDSAARNEIEYRPYAATDADAMTRLLADVFSHHDPLAFAVGVTAADFETFVRPLCTKVAAEGLTYVARRSDTGKMVGVLLTEDAASSAPEELSRLDKKFDPVMDILGEIVAEYRAVSEPILGESLHLFLLGVSDEATRQGVGQELVKAVLENGARRGYRMAFAEATNKVSQHIFRKLGFASRAHRSYLDYRFHGEAVFACIAEYGGPILMDKSFADGPRENAGINSNDGPNK
jgi:ribosomal protein S18 acetylase RimI-like enzyme